MGDNIITKSNDGMKSESTGESEPGKSLQMFCSWCQQYPDTADKIFPITGCKNIQHGSLKTHAASKKHQLNADCI